MLSKRIIACLDVRDGQVVKGINFEGLRSAGDSSRAGAALQPGRHRRAGHPRHHGDAGTPAGHGGDHRSVARELFIPLAVGGGIRTEDDAAAAVDAGADKVSLNTAALANPALITTLANRYGSQAVVVAIDAKRDGEPVRRLRPQRPDRGGPRRGRVGARGRGERRRRDSAHVHRSRRHQGRLRLRDDRGRVARRVDPGDRVWRRRRARSLRRRFHRRQRRRRPGRVDLSLRGDQRPRAQNAPAGSRDSSADDAMSHGTRVRALTLAIGILSIPGLDAQNTAPARIERTMGRHDPGRRGHAADARGVHRDANRWYGQSSTFPSRAPRACRSRPFPAPIPTFISSCPRLQRGRCSTAGCRATRLAARSRKAR